MNKLIQKITGVMVLLAVAFGSHTYAGAAPSSNEPNSFPSASQFVPGEAVVYIQPKANGTTIDNAQIESQFGLIIYAYSQMRRYPGRSGTELLYFDINKINGPAGLTAPGSVCSDSQKADTNYDSDTVTVGYTFCTILDAIKNRTPIYGIVPTEGIFLHVAGGARSSKIGSGGATYLINPADTFIRHYTVQRFLEKIAELGLDGGFADNLQPGWGKVTSVGTPVEYASWDAYNNSMASFACEIYSSLKAAGREVWGNMTAMDSPSVWAQYAACLDGAMAETWMTDWGGFPSASTMSADLSLAQAWLGAGKKVLLIAQDSDPDAASNQFVYASSLLVASDVSHTFYKYAHYNGSYAEYYAPPAVSLGTPRGPLYQVSADVWERSFDAGCVRVDLSKITSSITNSPCASAPAVTNTPQAPSPVPSATFTVAPTFTAAPTLTTAPTLTSVPTSIPVTSTPTDVPVLPTFTQIPASPTATAVAASPTAKPPEPTATNIVLPGSETIFDDKNAVFAYSPGWQDVTKRQAYDRSYKATNTNGSFVMLSFTGRSFSILYTSGRGYGNVNVYVDDVLVGTIRQNAKRTVFQSRWDFNGQLSYGLHTLKLELVATNGTKPNTGGMTLDAVIVR